MKTRMHEILGVEPGEVFEHLQRGLFYFVDDAGAVRECPDKDTNNWRHNNAPGHVISSMINLPEGIIRKPRLTPEQVEILKALRVLGCNWLTKDDDGRFEGWENKPYTTAGMWCERDENSLESCFVNLTGKKAMMIDELLTYGEPLSILQTLRDNGVEVDNG